MKERKGRGRKGTWTSRHFVSISRHGHRSIDLALSGVSVLLQCIPRFCSVRFSPTQCLSRSLNEEARIAIVELREDGASATVVLNYEAKLDFY